MKTNLKRILISLPIRTGYFLFFFLVLSCIFKGSPKFRGAFPLPPIPPPLAQITIEPSTQSLTTTEAGGSLSYKVSINKKPEDDILINISVSDTVEVKLDKSLLTFTTANWDQAQTFSITGQDDLFVDGNKPYTLNLSPSQSLDSEFAKLTIAPYSLQNLADDVIVYPGHGAGSACGKNMSKETTDSLGHQKQYNYALRTGMTRDEFIKEVTDGLVAPPQYFPFNVLMNIKGGIPSIDDVIKRGTKAFHPTRSAQNHLRMLADVGGASETRIAEVLDIVGLSDVAKKGPGKFSLGMSQRLGIAAAILGEPKYLVLDEPANGLDPEGIAWLRQFIRNYADMGNGVFVSSHLLSEMSQMADDVVVIGKGKFIVEGSIKDLVSGSSHAGVFVRSDNEAKLKEVLQSSQVKFVVQDGGVKVSGKSTDEIGKLLFEKHVSLLELTRQDASLEEAFLELTAGVNEFESRRAKHDR